MNHKHSTKLKTALIAVLAVAITSCATIAKFDEYAYTQTTSLKVDALNVMSHGHENYALYASQVTQVNTAIDKMYEYEKNRPKNATSEKMWSVLKDSTGNLFGGFIARWQKEGTLDTAFVRASQDLVSQSFDQISQLESQKIKP